MAAQKSGFLYFLPGLENEQVPSITRAAELGIGYAFERDTHIEKRRILSGGPGGSAGLLVFSNSTTSADRGKIVLASQEWRKFSALVEGDPPTNAWVGRWTDCPAPTWRDHRREQTIPGGEILADDGQAILIPTARQFSLSGAEQDSLCYTCGLPRLLDVDTAGGLMAGDVVSRYRRLWDLACLYDQASADALAEALEHAGDGDEVQVRFTFPAIHQLIHECLIANHRAGFQELLLLREYDSRFGQRVADILLDQATFLELQKKIGERAAARESTDSSNGPGEPNTAETAPTTATSPASESGEHSPPVPTGLTP